MSQIISFSLALKKTFTVMSEGLPFDKTSLYNSYIRSLHNPTLFILSTEKAYMLHMHRHYMPEKQHMPVTRHVGDCKIYLFRNLEKSRGCTPAAEAKGRNIGSLKQPFSQKMIFPLAPPVKSAKINTPTKLRQKSASTYRITFCNHGLSIVADSGKKYGARKESLTDTEWLSMYVGCNSIHQ